MVLVHFYRFDPHSDVLTTRVKRKCYTYHLFLVIFIYFISSPRKKEGKLINNAGNSFHLGFIVSINFPVKDTKQNVQSVDQSTFYAEQMIRYTVCNLISFWSFFISILLHKSQIKVYLVVFILVTDFFDILVPLKTEILQQIDNIVK